MKYSPTGTPIAKFSLATNERFKDRSGEWQERVESHSIVAWKRLAEIVGEFVTAGFKVYIEGKLQTSSWEDGRSDQARYRTDIVARDLGLLSSRGNGRNESPRDRSTPAAHHETPAENAADLEDIPF